MAKKGSSKALLRPPTAAGRQRRTWGLLEWAKQNPGAGLAAAASVAFVVVCSVWSPLGPEQFASVRCHS